MSQIYSTVHHSPHIGQPASPRPSSKWRVRVSSPFVGPEPTERMMYERGPPCLGLALSRNLCRLVGGHAKSTRHVAGGFTKRGGVFICVAASGSVDSRVRDNLKQRSKFVGGSQMYSLPPSTPASVQRTCDGLIKLHKAAHQAFHQNLAISQGLRSAVRAVRASG